MTSPRPSQDQQRRAHPVGGYKQDFNLYTGAGFGGGGSLTVSNQQAYSYFVDYSNFDVYIREVIVQNASFQVFSDSGGVNSMPLYFGVQNSNDRPASDIIAKAAAAGLKFTTPPPYNIDIQNLVQPFGGVTTIIADGGTALSTPIGGNYFYDQGGYIYSPVASASTLYGITYGNNNKMVQSFVPQSNKILNIAISALWMDTSQNYNDHTIYSDIIVEVWNSSLQVIYTQTISRFANPITGNVPASYPYTWDLLDSERDFTADDGKSYWTALVGLKLQPASPIQVIPGQTYYLCFKPATNGTVNRYGVSTNAIGGVVNSSLGSYPNGTLYFAAYSSTTLTPQGPTGVGIGFVTTRPNGRFCVTAAWDSSAYYWHNPATNFNQIKVLKVDTDRRI